MASVVRVVEVTCPTSGSTFDVTHTDIGTCTGYLILAGNVDGVTDNDCATAIGVGDGTDERCLCTFDEDNQSATSNTYKYVTGDPLRVLDGTTGSSIYYNATFNSFITNGVRFNRGTSDTGIKILVVLFGGDVDDTECHYFAVSGSGTLDGSVTVTPGFQADTIFFITQPGVNDRGICFGIYDRASSAQHCNFHYSDDGAATSAIYAKYENDRVGTIPSSANLAEFEITNVTSTQFDITTRNSTTYSTTSLFGLAVKFSSGYATDLSDIPTNGSTGVESYNVGINTPDLILGCSTNCDSTGAVENASYRTEEFALGYYDGTNQVCYLSYSDDGLTTTNSRMQWLSGNFLHTQRYEINGDSFDSDGYNLDWVDAESSAIRGFIWTWKDASGGAIDMSVATVSVASPAFDVQVTTNVEMTTAAVSVASPAFTVDLSAPTSAVKIQRGVTDVALAGSTASITAVSSLDNAFVRLTNNRGCSAGPDASASNMEADDLSCTAVLTATDTITFTRTSGSTSNTVKVAWEVWEFTGSDGSDNEFIVRSRNTFTSGTAQSLDTTPTDRDKCIPFYSIRSEDTSNGGNELSAILRINSSGNLEITRGATSANFTLEAVVVEFTGGNWTVGHGYASTTADVDTVDLVDDSYGVTGTATTHTTANTLIFAHGAHTTDSISATSAVYTWADSDTVNASHDANAAGTHNHMVHTLEHPDMDVTVYSNTSFTQDATNVDCTSAGLTDLEMATVVGASESSGAGTAYGRGFRNYRLTSLTNVEHWCHRSGNTGNHSLQIADLSGIEDSSATPTDVNMTVEAISVASPAFDVSVTTTIEMTLAAVSVASPAMTVLPAIDVSMTLATQDVASPAFEVEEGITVDMATAAVSVASPSFEVEEGTTIDMTLETVSVASPAFGVLLQVDVEMTLATVDAASPAFTITAGTTVDMSVATADVASPAMTVLPTIAVDMALATQDVSSPAMEVEVGTTIDAALATVDVASPAFDVSAGTTVDMTAATVDVASPEFTVTLDVDVDMTLAAVSVASPAMEVEAGTTIDMTLAAVQIASPAFEVEEGTTIAATVGAVEIASPPMEVGVGVTVEMTTGTVDVASPALDVVVGTDVEASLATVDIAAPDFLITLESGIEMDLATQSIASLPFDVVVGIAVEMTTAAISVASPAFTVVPAIDVEISLATVEIASPALEVEQVTTIDVSVATQELASPAFDVQVGVDVSMAVAAMSVASPAFDVDLGVTVQMTTAAITVASPACTVTAGTTIEMTTAAVAVASPAFNVAPAVAIEMSLATVEMASPAFTVIASTVLEMTVASVDVLSPALWIENGTDVVMTAAAVSVASPAFDVDVSTTVAMTRAQIATSTPEFDIMLSDVPPICVGAATPTIVAYTVEAQFTAMVEPTIVDYSVGTDATVTTTPAIVSYDVDLRCGT